MPAPVKYQEGQKIGNSYFIMRVATPAHYTEKKGFAMFLCACGNIYEASIEKAFNTPLKKQNL